jgi:hypothetical protein
VRRLPSTQDFRRRRPRRVGRSHPERPCPPSRQPFCEACRRSTAKRQIKVMDDRIQPRRTSRRWSQYAFGEALRDLAPAQDGVAAETAGNHPELYDPPRKQQIGHASPIPVWIGQETVPHDGHRPTVPDARNAIMALSPFVVRSLYHKPRATRRCTRGAAARVVGTGSQTKKDIPKQAVIAACCSEGACPTGRMLADTSALQDPPMIKTLDRLP